MHCRSSRWVIGSAIHCLLVTGLLGQITAPIEGTLDFTPETEAVLPAQGSQMRGNSALPVASEMKENSALAVKIDGTSLSSHAPVERTSRDLRRISATTRKNQVRRSQTLSAGEQQYVVERKNIVLEALNDLGIDCTLESVPHVALLGSVGGERAAVSLMGSLGQMKTDGLLDTLLYLGGLSGSSWWFEFTPHESGFTDLGLFINTAHLGSSLQEHKPEMDMVRIQGIVSSALADEQSIISEMPDELKDAVGWTLTDDDNLMDLALLWVEAPKQTDTVWSATNMYMRLQHTLAKLTLMVREKTKDDPTVQSKLDGMEEAFKAHMNLNPVMFGKTSPKQRKKLFDSWSAAIIKPIEDWSQSLEKGPFRDFVNWSVQKLFPVIGRWEWGTTENFLYKYPDFSVPSCLWSNKHMQLMDASSMLSMPYPPFLGDKRHVDLIIAMDYCSGDPFRSLTEARDYAAKANKPFPEINGRILEEKDWPNDCYVLQGERDQPTIIYMPLFNRKNCKDAEQMKQRIDEYSTIHLPYTQEQVEFLMETAATNMKNSKNTILTELHRTEQRKRYNWR